MAVLKLSLGFRLSIFFWILISTTVSADPSLEELDALHLSSELELLKARISFLESKIEERDYESRKKDHSQMEKFIQEKSDKGWIANLLEQWLVFTSYLEPHVRYFAAKTVDIFYRAFQVFQEWIAKFSEQWLVYTSYLEPHVRCFAAKTVDMLYKAFQVFQEWIANFSEQWLLFTSYLEPHVQCLAAKTIDMFYKAFQVFQEWIAIFSEQWLVYTSYLEPHVRCFAAKTVDMFYKAFQVFQEWIAIFSEQWLVFTSYLEPHVRCFVAKIVDMFYKVFQEWIPILSEHWLVFTSYLEPHVRCFAAKIVDMYYKLKNYAVPQAFQVFQETKIFTRPYADQMATVGKLRWLEYAQLALELYQKTVAGAYQKIINFAASYLHPEWIPNLSEQWLVFASYLESHARCFAAKTVDTYYKLKNYAVPQAFQVFQETKEFTKPYINQMAMVGKRGWLENAQLALELYQKIVAGAFQKIINFAASYLHKVYGGWNSLWLADCLTYPQSLWNESGGLLANKAYQKLLERKKSQVWQWLNIYP